MAAEKAPDVGALLAELEWLIREEAQLSATRRHLHDVLDVGFANAMTLARERQISAERQRIHRRIDALRRDLAGMVWEPHMPLSEVRRLQGLGL
jgi:hypothetical protein